MQLYFTGNSLGRIRTLGSVAALALAGVLATADAHAQAPTWNLALAAGGSPTTGSSLTRAMTTDASGNVLVVGSFTGTITFGTTTLNSAGVDDLFLAKWVPATSTWAWAVRGGGNQSDQATGVAVRGSSIYVAGTIFNSTNNVYSVTFGPGATTQWGATPTAGQDMVLAKFTDNGTSATLNWTQVAGGSDNDQGAGVAVGGTNLVYLVGSVTNNLANGNRVLFGGSGTTLGTVQQAGAVAGGATADLMLARYTDNGSSATCNWTQVAGGKGADGGTGVAVSGSSVYVTGSITNDQANSQTVLFGGYDLVPGQRAQAGASTTSSADMVLARYTDNGATTTATTVDWMQVAGGSDDDSALGLAVAGSSVYVTGYLSNDLTNTKGVRFGGSGLQPGPSLQAGASAQPSLDMVLAKYQDNSNAGQVRWTQVAGGLGTDFGYGVAVGGGRVYVTGHFTNDQANSNAVTFGGTGTTAGTASQAGASSSTSYDLVAAGYLDNGLTGTFRWSQVGGGTGRDFGYAAALSGTRLYVGGASVPASTFGSLSLSAPAGSLTTLLAGLDLTATLAATPAAAAAAPRLWPNPASGPATLSGAAAHAPVQVLDALGRPVATATADATGTTPLPAGLAPGLYLVRAGAATVRWAVQ